MKHLAGCKDLGINKEACDVDFDVRKIEEAGQVYEKENEDINSRHAGSSYDII